MPGLALQRCFHHEEREAVSRCPNCERFFCRECVSHYEGRLLCSHCVLSLSAEVDRAERIRPAPSAVLQVFLAALALVMVWVVFYLMGWTLLQMREPAPVAASTDPLYKTRLT